ncbi:MAG: SLC13 family permease [bacterium]|nr:SLC13 family permease [bacterium]
MSLRQKAGLIIGPVIFFIFNYYISFENLSTEGSAVLAVTIWTAIWWVTEPIPIPATSLLPIILLPITNGAPIQQTTAAYGDKMLFLFVGGFIIAIAIEKWNLHKRIALTIVNAIGSSTKMIILGFMIATGFLSMWISNTATTLMMVTIAAAITKEVPNTKGFNDFSKALLLSIAYSASIGGMATLVGTPTNPIFVAQAEKLYGIEVSFSSWIVFGLPIVIFLILFAWYSLTNITFSLKDTTLPEANLIDKQLKAMGRISKEERTVLMVFALTAIAWISRPFLLGKFIPGINDTIIALTGATSLFLLPSSIKNERIIDWESAKELPWGVILLFGGGLSLAAAFKSSGLAVWLGDQFAYLGDLNLLLLVLIIVILINFMTEITSNVATASIMLPVLASMANTLEINPFSLMVGCTLAASCAFMLPVATAPNAIVFGTKKLQITDMVRAGLMLNLISSIIIGLVAYFIVPFLIGK